MSAEELRRVVERLHNCSATHRGSAMVEEAFQDQIVWRGYVELFDLTGHPTATRCYAWAHDTDSGGTRYQAVLELPPVDCPEAAVRAAIAADFRREHGSQKG